MLVITSTPLFSWARKCDAKSAAIVVGIIEIDIIGINSKVVLYSGRNIGIIIGAIKIPINANTTEKRIVIILIFVVFFGEEFVPKDEYLSHTIKDGWC